MSYSLSCTCVASSCFSIFFFNDTATTEIYTLSLHDALPISVCQGLVASQALAPDSQRCDGPDGPDGRFARAKGAICRQGRLARSEEHTSELQSRLHLVCRLLLEKKKNTQTDITTNKIY